MENQSAHLSALFHALSDPTRRAVIGRLGRGPATVSDLAAPFDMALPSFMKHIRLLEHAGWIRSTKDGRVRTCALQKKTFTAVEGWLSQQRVAWERRTDRLERFITTQQKRLKAK